MAINGLPQAGLSGSSNVPLWKLLGYKSYQEYVNATSGAQSGMTAVSPTDSLLDRYRYKSWNPTGDTVGSYEEKLGRSLGGGVVSSPKISGFDLEKYLDPNVVGRSDSGIGGGIGGGRGGVTDEGLVVGGSTGNLERFPTVGNSGVKTPSPAPTPESPKPSSPSAETTPTPPQKDNLLDKTIPDNVSPSTGSTVPTGGSSGGSASPSEDTSVPANSAEFDAKYQGNDFLEWYKANYGTDFDPNVGFSRSEGMSDVDWAIGNSLYNSYLTGRNLENEYNANRSQAEERYNAALDALNTNKRNAQQNASITLDKLKKYLPTQIKAQGLGGLGVSESSVLKAYNNYQNNMGEIEGNYNTNKSTIDTNRETTLTDLQRAYQDSKTNLDIAAGEQSQGIFEKYRDADKAAKEKDYSDALDALLGSTSVSADELMQYVERFRGRVSNEQYNTLVQQAQQVAQANLSAQQRSLRDELSAMIQGSTNASESELLQRLEQYRGRVSDDQFKALQDQARQRAYANTQGEQQSTFQEVMDVIISGSFNTPQELESFVNSFKGRVSDDQWGILQQYVKLYKDSPDEQRRQEAVQEQKELDKFNSVTSSDVTFNNNGGWGKLGATDYSEGDNFSVKDPTGFVYRIQSGGEISDSNIINAARDIGDNSVFGYGGKVYFKKGGRVYLVEARDGSYGNHYDKLYKRIFG